MGVKVVVGRGWVVAVLAVLAGCGSSHLDGGGSSAGSGGGGNAGSGGPAFGGTGGGAAGTTGAAGSTGDNDAGSMACGTHASRAWPSLAITTDGAGGASYDGPATIEGSTATTVTITFAPASGEAARHSTITGLSPMPQFSPGSNVWLSQIPIAQPPYPNAASGGPIPWAFSVRDRQGGRLLFGAT